MKYFIFILSFVITTAAMATPQSQWKDAMNLGLKDKPQDGVKILESLLKSGQTAIDHDEIIMAQARLKFQAGKFEEALALYSKIPKSSDFWLQSLEEKAWTFIRQSKYENAIAQYQTLNVPAFAPQVGPEAYLIGSFSNLKICDYKSVFDVLKDFKAKYKNLIPELETLAKTGDSPAVQRAIKKLAAKDVLWSDLGPDVQKLPQFMNRDVQLLNLIKAGKSEAIKSRVKVLAQADLDSLSKIVQKLHIVEVEAIQRMSVKTAKTPTLNRDSKNGDAEVLNFPKEDEVWLDEVTHYQVHAKGCQQQVAKGTKL